MWQLDRISVSKVRIEIDAHHQDQHVGHPARYGQSEILFPAVNSDGESMHPLLSWWAILFGLSVLTRYEPDRWTRLSISSTPLKRLRSNICLKWP